MDMTLGMFVNKIVGALYGKDIKLPYDDEKAWHLLFYSLKKTDGSPSCIKELIFDWDGQFPRCRKLSNYINALHLNACISVDNPSFSSIKISEGLAKEWDKIKIDEKETDFFHHALGTAKQYFNQSASDRC